jgi:DNA-binding response OmpR family regulator
MRILVAEDDAILAEGVTRVLRQSGYAVDWVKNGAEADSALEADDFDLLILDIGLPRRDGFTVLRRLREARVALPVIILTARDSVGDKVAGLEGGADDYLPKPFAFDELLARIRLRLHSDRAPELTVLRSGNLALDLRTRRAQIGGHQVDLSAREFALVELMLRHPGQVLTREQLLSHVWGFDFDPGSNIVDVYVRRLRRKLGSDLIQTVRGMGYRLRGDGNPPDTHSEEQ